MSRYLNLKTLTIAASLLVLTICMIPLNTYATGKDKTQKIADFNRWMKIAKERSKGRAFADPRIVIQFPEEAKIRAIDGYAVSKADWDTDSFNTLLARYGAELEPRFIRSYEELEQTRKQAEEQSGKTPPDLTRFAQVYVPDGVVPEELLTVIREHPLVRAAWRDPVPEPAVVVDIPPVTPDFRESQGYLESAPEGIGARWTRLAFEGAAGQGIMFSDIEGGWNTYHEDLDLIPAAAGDSIDADWWNHGTAVIGEVVGAGNEYGITGVTPAVDFVWMVSIAHNIGLAAAIDLATVLMDVGDVYLIELHAEGPETGHECPCNCEQFEYVAMEYWQDNFDAIQLSTMFGRICIEAGGNGSVNYDWEVYGDLFDRDARDSGAIMTGAAQPGNLVGECWTNNGSRIDLFAWGSQIVTTGYGGLFDGNGDQNQYYTPSFGGTSGSSPIITGAAISIQGLVKAITDSTWDAATLRDFLSSHGTPYNGEKAIGVMPDLEEMIEILLPGERVQNLTASENMDEGIFLQWDPVQGAESYRVERMDPDDYAQFELVADLEMTEYFDSEAETGMNTYRVVPISEEPAAGTVTVGRRIPVQDPPMVVSPIPDLFFVDGEPDAYLFDLDTVFVDPEGEDLLFSVQAETGILARIAGGSILGVQVIPGTPYGDYQLVVTAEDNYNTTGSDTAVVYITPGNVPHFQPVEPTGMPYAIVVESALIDQEPLNFGDEIAVFDDQLCVGVLSVDDNWPSPVSAWQGDPARQLPGFTQGNPIFYRFWSQQDQAEYNADAEYLRGNGTFGFGAFSDVNLTAEQLSLLTVPLQANYFEWISFNLEPEDPRAEEVFVDLESLSIVYRDDGGIYIPYLLNTLFEIDPTEGYRIFITETDTLIVSGDQVVPDLQFHLDGNRWNWIGYPFEEEVPVEIGLQQAAIITAIVMTDDGRIWIPGQINTIGNMHPGEGYALFAGTDWDFQFVREGFIAGNNNPLAETFEPVIQDEAVQPTGKPFAVLVHLDRDLEAWNPGRISLYDGERLVGQTAWEDEKSRVPVIAWEEAPDFGLDGFHNGNPVTLRLEDRSGVILLEQETGQRFGDDPYAEVFLDAESISTLPAEFQVGNAYPNPFNPSTNLPIVIPGTGEVKIMLYNVLGRVVYEESHLLQAGRHRINIDPASRPGELVSGVYFLQVLYDGQRSAQKIVLMR